MPATSAAQFKHWRSRVVYEMLHIVRLSRLSGRRMRWTRVRLKSVKLTVHCRLSLHRSGAGARRTFVTRAAEPTIYAGTSSALATASEEQCYAGQAGRVAARTVATGRASGGAPSYRSNETPRLLTMPARPPRRTSRAGAKRSPTRRWSREVTLHSNALDLTAGVFNRPPKEMARSLKRSADRSTRRKASPFRSAMSMLIFYENRAGRNLSAARKRAIQAAKAELRRLYGRAR
jgi:hypothetical protein